MLAFEAQQTAEQWLLEGSFTRCDTTFEEPDERALTTAIGHVAFKHLLRVRKIGFKAQDSGDSATAKSQFLIHAYGEAVVNIRTARTGLRPRAEWFFGIPIGEMPRSADRIVVGCWNPSQEVVAFYGSIPAPAIAQPVSGGYYCSYRANDVVRGISRSSSIRA
jgi:hypothetical protein